MSSTSGRREKFAVLSRKRNAKLVAHLNAEALVGLEARAVRNLGCGDPLAALKLHEFQA